MMLKFNAATIVDLVLDEMLNQEQLQAIANQLYLDKRGGELAHLYGNEEFLNALEDQLA